MLDIFIAGRGIYRDNKGHVIRVYPGMVALIFPSPDVGILMSDPKNPYEYFFCRFAGKEAERTARHIIKMHGGRHFFKWKYWQNYLDVFRRLEFLGPVYPMLHTNDIMTQLDGVCAYLLTCIANPVVNTEFRVTAINIEKYMQDHMAEPINLDQMASDFGVSKGYLCRSSRRFFNLTLAQKWKTIKMEWAQYLLLDVNLSVGEVARHVGFEDQFHFSRVFKKYFGKPPSRKRKLRKKKTT